MLGIGSRNNQNMPKFKAAAGRSSALSRGGVRKRGAPPRADRDGDLDMGAGSTRGRDGKRGRGHGGLTHTRGSAKMELDTDRLQKAIESGTANSHINIRQGSNRPRFEEISVTGWKESKAISNPGGVVKSTVDWLERKLPGSKNIIKVCPTSGLAVTDAVSAQSRIFPRCAAHSKTNILNCDRYFSRFFLASIPG